MAFELSLKISSEPPREPRRRKKLPFKVRVVISWLIVLGFIHLVVFLVWSAKTAWRESIGELRVNTNEVNKVGASKNVPIAPRQ